jgi:hypothetical protein
MKKSHSRFFVLFLQGTGLEIRPEPMRAVDQDAGINASIRYAWNAGNNNILNCSFGFFPLTPTSNKLKNHKENVFLKNHVFFLK